tara:strand:- start:4 stop:399 length:396 start_codon:yes stop_codon:yes gene_type:complete
VKINGEIKIRVRYSETDKMGFVYYGNYAEYFEVARVELLRKLGIIYSNLEDLNIGLPVKKFNIDYLKPALYDEELSIYTSLELSPPSSLVFKYVTTNSKKEKINTAITTLVAIDLKSKRPIKIPKVISELF